MIDLRTDRQWTDGWTDGRTDRRTDGQANGWTNGWTNGKKDPLLSAKWAKKKLKIYYHWFLLGWTYEQTDVQTH